MATSAQAKQGFLDAHERFFAADPRVADNSDVHTRVAELRRIGIERFGMLAFPGPKNEDWKYTSVASLVAADFDPAPAARSEIPVDRVSAIIDAAVSDQSAQVLVFVDGSPIAELSRNLDEVDTAVCVMSFEQAATENPKLLSENLGQFLDTNAHGFTALNSAFLSAGAVVFVSAGKHAARPVHLVFVGGVQDKSVSHPRTLIIAEPGSSATVAEHYVGLPDSSYLANAATEIVLGRGARLSHCKLQREAAGAFHVARIQVHQGEGSEFVSHAVAVGARLSRTEIHVALDAPEASCSLYGLYALEGDAHADHHTVIDHAQPRTRSTELYKGIMDGRSRGVFTGRVLVRPDAQKISASQSNSNLLLGAGAVAETRPQLEIYADDVQCNHGATIGRLDEDALFYMRQRGIGPGPAKRMLTLAFAAEVTEHIADPHLRASAERAVHERVEHAVLGGNDGADAVHGSGGVARDRGNGGAS